VGVLRLIRDFRRACSLGSQLGRASRLQRAERFAEAKVVLLDLLAETGGAESELLIGVIVSTRLTAITRLAILAAKLGDRELADSSIRDGLALWAKVRLEMPRVRGIQSFVEWEKWARAYQAWAAAVERDPGDPR
jgi:hypothetical protein